MKQKIIKSILIILILFIFFVPNNAFAITSKGQYDIDSYNINMIVNENNSFDITETITVFFHKKRHGIYRTIPIRNKIKRENGKSTVNHVKLRGISVDAPYKISKGFESKIIKIGDNNTTVQGKKTYTIKYNYDIGKDPLKNEDELYFNLIGSEWDTSVDNITFTIAMPKQFDKSCLKFVSGYNTLKNIKNVNYTINGNIIKGSYDGTLPSGKILAIKISLPEGYFSGERINIDVEEILKMVLCILLTLIAYVIWKKYGEKNDDVVDTLEFEIPDGLNSIDIGYIYKNGSCNYKDVVSLLIYLANKGYLRIEETYKDNKNDDFKIIKLREYDGNNSDEKTFFNELFQEKNEVTNEDLKDNFYMTVDKIVKNKNKRVDRKKLFNQKSLKMRIILMVILLIIFLASTNGYYILSGGCSTEISVLMWMSIFIAFITLYIYYEKISIYLNLILFIFYTLVAKSQYAGIIPNLSCVVEIICITAVIIFLGKMGKRSEYGKRIYEKVLGFRNFLLLAKKSYLEEQVKNNSEYFYEILPYAYVLEISEKWIKKFEKIAINNNPIWYWREDKDDYKIGRENIGYILDTCIQNIQDCMISSPGSSDESSGSSSSGGGSSGGSSGGSGGRRRRLMVM